MLAFRDIKTSMPFSKYWLLIPALVVGLVYLFLLPPWQQNDEPGQFEYVWLAAYQKHWPQPGDINNQLRRDIMASMIEHGFYKAVQPQPDFALLQVPVDIGVSQLDGLPLYYLLASLPLRLFPTGDVTTLLYLARLTSLALFAATVFFAVKTTDLLFGNHVVGWMIILFIAMLPQLAYRMTAVNDDAAAIAAVTFFVWMSVQGIIIGPNWKSILGILVGLLFCILSKQTAWIAIPFGLLVLLLMIFHTQTRWVWGGVFCLSVLAVFFAFDWQPVLPAEYYQQYNIPKRAERANVIDGKYVFAINKKYSGFYQVLDKTALDAASEIADHKVTVGAWVWANQPVETSFLQLQINGTDTVNVGNVSLSEQPVFLAAQTQIPKSYDVAVMRVDSNNLPSKAEIYWDCLILVPGARNKQFAPTTSENCGKISWDGYTGKNLIRNPSAERGWFPLREKVAAFFYKAFRAHQITDLWAILDTTTSGVYYQNAIEYMYRTFWGRFNWGTLALAGNKPYRVFIIPTVLAFLGIGKAFGHYRKFIFSSQIMFLLLLVIVDFLFTIFRFAGGWHNYYNLLPQARYFFPVILPTAIFICLGWYTWLEIIFKKDDHKERFLYIFFALFLLYNGWAWYTIWSYWYT